MVGLSFIVSSVCLLAGFAAATPQTAAAAPAAAADNNLILGTVGIGVSNFTRSYDFYTKVLGWRDTGAHLETELFDETILSPPSKKAGAIALLLMTFKPPRPTTHLPVKLVLFVDNVSETFAKVKAAGAKVILEPVDIPGGFSIPIGMAEDPDGYLLEFNQN